MNDQLDALQVDAKIIDGAALVNMLRPKRLLKIMFQTHSFPTFPMS